MLSKDNYSIFLVQTDYTDNFKIKNDKLYLYLDYDLKKLCLFMNNKFFNNRGYNALMVNDNYIECSMNELFDGKNKKTKIFGIVDDIVYPSSYKGLLEIHDSIKISVIIKFLFDVIDMRLVINPIIELLEYKDIDCDYGMLDMDRNYYKNLWIDI
jgi:hypothetical protein